MPLASFSCSFFSSPGGNGRSSRATSLRYGKPSSRITLRATFQLTSSAATARRMISRASAWPSKAVPEAKISISARVWGGITIWVLVSFRGLFGWRCTGAASRGLPSLYKSCAAVALSFQPVPPRASPLGLDEAMRRSQPEPCATSQASQHCDPFISTATR